VTLTATPLVRAPSRAGGWLLAAAPATRLAALRVLIGGYCVARLLSTAPSLVQLADLPDRQFAPVGVLSPLGAPPPAALVVTVLVLAVAAGIAFVLGWRWQVDGPLFAIAFFLLSTYRVSWGHVSHADHLPALQLLLCGVVSAADAWSLDARRRRGPRRPAPDPRYGWPIKVLGLITVVTYVLAGLAKVRYGGMGWLDGDALRNQIAADALQKTLLGATRSPLVGWVTSNSWVLVPASILAVVIELAAPVAFLGGRWRDAWVASAWLLHVAIAAVMAITFPYPLSGVAFAPFYELERGVAVIGRRWRRGDAAAGP
jgi:HTTM domain